MSQRTMRRMPEPESVRPGISYSNGNIEVSLMEIEIEIDWLALEAMWAQRYAEDLEHFISLYPAKAGS